MQWRTVKQVGEVVALVTATISIPLGFYKLWDESAQQNRLMALKAYDDLDNRYIEYETLCLQYVRLDCADRPLKNPPTLTATEKVQQKLLFNIVLAMLERAYVMYHDVDAETRNEYWSGWDRYAGRYMERPAFMAVWRENESEYSERFRKYVNDKMQASPRADNDSA